MKSVAIFTGSRTEYGILKPIISGVAKSRKLELMLIVGGVHFLKKYGQTVDLIMKDGFKIAAEVQFSSTSDFHGRAGEEVGSATIKLTKVLAKLGPDIVLVNGDRSEALACAVSTVFLPTFLAHSHGGDITKGGTDESVRHAITKLANIHFAATEQSAQRIIQMGENPKNVFWVGAPGLDEFLETPAILAKVLEKELKIQIRKPLLIVLQHPVTTSVKTTGWEMAQTLKAIASFGGTKIIIYPNADPGSEAMIGEIEKYRKVGGFYIFPNIERELYINLLRQAQVLVGNSSGGIIETASIPIPAVNIGPRQTARQRNANILDVDYDEIQIKKAIKKCLTDRQFLNRVAGIKNLWGDGTASAKIVKILETINLDQNLLQKHFYVAKN